MTSPSSAREAWLAREVDRLRGSRRRARWLACGLAGLALALGLGTAERRSDFGPTPRRPPVGPHVATAAAADDPVYDEALRAYPHLRRDLARRQALSALLHAAATEQRVDPDLLFAVVAVESGFDGRAVSARGARGLGQLLFGTAREVAPEHVRRPADLHDPARNLAVTARLLRSLLDARGGDLPLALRAYYGGAWDRHRHAEDRDRYWVRVATRYATLKALRAYRALPPADGPLPVPRDG